ncbi:MAG: DUF2318 domain-containing protein [Bifidobacteriaceae bacterium]|jgi:uncharacterized membrane protein|nr:DUF2318 domain-containing protein [Bifidobacteriaceae bacterium]
MLGQLVAVTAGLGPAALMVAVIAVAGLSGRSAKKSFGGFLAEGSERMARATGRTLAAATAIGITAGLALALVRELTGMSGREVVSLWTGAASLVALATLAVATWLPGKANGSSKTSGPTRLWLVAAAAVTALTWFQAVPAVLLQLSSFVVPGTSAVSTDSLMRLFGFALGVALVALVAVFAVRAADGASARTGRLALTGAVAAGTVTTLVSLAQLLIARRLIDLPRPVFKAVAWGINHQSLTLWILAAIAVVPALTMLKANRHPATGGANPARDRLAKALGRRRLHYTLASAATYAAIGWVVTFGVAIEHREPELSPPEQYEVIDGLATIDLDAIDDGHLHRFAYTTEEGVEVRFIVIKKNGVAYGVGLDACEVCGPTGYYEKDGKIICRLCDVIMNVATIGFKGGCNPIPLEYTLDGGQLLVQAADLEAASDIFA